MSKVFTIEELDDLAKPQQVFSANELDALAAAPPAEHPYGDAVRPGQRGMPPRTPTPELSRRGAPPPVPAEPLPIPKTDGRTPDESVLDPLIDLIGEHVRPHLPKIFEDFINQPRPVREALADTLRGATSPENLMIMAGLGAANAVPGLGPAVDIGAVGYFGKQMIDAGVQAQGDMEDAQKKAAAARKRGDKAQAQFFEDKATKARASKWISSTLAGLLATGSGKRVLKKATDRVGDIPNLKPEEVQARVKADATRQSGPVYTPAELDTVASGSSIPAAKPEVAESLTETPESLTETPVVPETPTSPVAPPPTFPVEETPVHPPEGLPTARITAPIDPTDIADAERAAENRVVPPPEEVAPLEGPEVPERSAVQVRAGTVLEVTPEADVPTEDDEPATNDYHEAQQRIDRYEDQLAEKYGERAVIQAPLEGPSTNSPISRGELSKLRKLYASRDAIDQAEVEQNVDQIDKQFEPLIADKAERRKLVRKLAQADIPTALRAENNPDAWRGVGKLVDTIAHYISEKIAKDRRETAFTIEAVRTPDEPGAIQLLLHQEEGLGPSQKTIRETQRWLDHLFPEDTPRMPGGREEVPEMRTALPAAERRALPESTEAAPERPPSDLKTFRDDLDVLRQHPARGGAADVSGGEEYGNYAGRLGKAFEDAPDHVKADYLDKLEVAAGTHHPDVVQRLDLAQQFLTAGKPQEAAIVAELARAELREEYGRQLAADTLEKAGMDVNELSPESRPRAKKAATKPVIEEEQPKTERERLVWDHAATLMEAWAEDVRHAQEQLKRGESAATSESNYEGKLVEEEMAKRANSIRSLGVKEGSPLEAFPESPDAIAEAIEDHGGRLKDSKKMKLYQSVQRAYREFVDKEYGDVIEEHLTKPEEEPADERDELAEPEDGGDISFDFGEAGHSPLLDDVVRKLNDAIDSIQDYITIDGIPRLTKAGVYREAVEHASARTAVPHMIEDILSRVFADVKDQKMMERVMRVMVLDNILGGYDDLERSAGMAWQRGDELGVARIMKIREAVEKKHDLAAYDTEVRAAKQEPKVVAAIQRWKMVVNPLMDQLYNEMKGMDPQSPRDGRGRIFGTRVNLLAATHVPEWLKAAVDDEAPVPAEPQGSMSSFRNPNVRKDRFDRMARFSAGEYATDPVAVLASALFPRWNEVTKRRLYNALVAEGVGAWERPASGQIRGEPAVSAPIEVPETKNGKTRPVNKVLWLPKSLQEEFRGVLGTDLPLEANAVGRFLTKLQVTQLADATAHLKNIHSVVASALGSAKTWTDVVRKMPGISSVDSIVRIAGVMNEIAQDGPAVRREIAEMAKAGMIRQHFPHLKAGNVVTRALTALPRAMQTLIHDADTGARVVMNRFYDNLIDRGLAENNFESRRKFVQQIGEYNKRLMGPLMRAASQSGLSPFIVAGRNFNRFSRRLLTGAPGFTPTSRAAAAQSRMVNFVTLGSLFTLPAMLNVLSTGSIAGRPGTPIGAIDLNMDPDQRGNHKVLDLLQLYGVRRGMRTTGLEALSNGLKNGASPDDIAGRAIFDAAGAVSHPWLGPALAFGVQAITGSRLDLRGGPMPEQGARMNSAGAQFREYLRVAAKNQNLLLYSPFRRVVGDVEETPLWDFAKDFLKAPASAIGLSDRPTPALQAARDAAIHIQMTPEQKSRGQTRRQILAAYDAKDEPRARALQSKAKLTPGELTEIIKERKMSSIERSTWRLPLEVIVDDVWPRATPEERVGLRRIIATKVYNATPVTGGIEHARAILRGPR